MRWNGLIGTVAVVGTLAVAATTAGSTGPETPRPAPAAAPAPTALAELEFLLGRWEAAGSGAPGAASGTTSFEPAADGHALLRHNLATTPRGLHADVMLIYRDADGGIRALYADNEGHVIRYDVTLPPGGNQAVFVSVGGAGDPRFRLTHALGSDGTLATRFEVAAPGGAEFTTYLEGSGRRTST